MTKWNGLNVQLLDSQLNELTSVTKYATETTSKLSSNIVVNLSEKTIWPHKLLLFIRKVAIPPRAFANNSPANSKLTKEQMYETILSISFLGKFFGLSMNVG